MADILQFCPRLRKVREPSGPVNVRAEIEEAAQFALDTADRLIALLDGMESEPDEEPAI